ncbi:apolipoprotein E-like [Melopsittacus undulatus]|uniref:apolipoprotein E-like n=1 Tax=Melopsittacus undulatus TaxID=13146 RepID=UPI00146EEC3B|nr:apolipoprotein E-like [Melopsittacus undulatus]
MRLFLVLVAATVLLGCGAEPPTTKATPPPTKTTPSKTTPPITKTTPPPTVATPPPPSLWGALEGAALNVTARVWGSPIVTRMRLMTSSLGAHLSSEAREARERAGLYAREARAALARSLAELRTRGALCARRMRRRLQRDREELRRRWEGWGRAVARMWAGPVLLGVFGYF